MRWQRGRLASLLIMLLISCADVFGQNPATAPSPGAGFVTLPAELMNRELTTIRHKRLKLADHSDRIIILNLFASWSPPCLPNLADLVSLHKHDKGRRIEIIGLVWDQNDRDLRRLREFVRSQRVNFPVVWYHDDFGELLQKLVNARSVIPQTFVIDRDGRIRKHFLGFSRSQTPKILRDVLAEIRKEMDAK